MNIYISNLSYDVNDSDLRELFEEYGEVSSAKVIMDRETGTKNFRWLPIPSKYTLTSFPTSRNSSISRKMYPTCSLVEK